MRKKFIVSVLLPMMLAGITLGIFFICVVYKMEEKHNQDNSEALANAGVTMANPTGTGPVNPVAVSGPVSISIYPADEDRPGYIAFTISDQLGPMSRWGNWQKVAFVDDRFDGILDRVVLVSQGGTIINATEATARDGNGTIEHPWVGGTWVEWQERYRYVRRAATFGKYYQE